MRCELCSCLCCRLSGCGVSACTRSERLSAGTKQLLKATGDSCSGAGTTGLPVGNRNSSNSSSSNSGLPTDNSNIKSILHQDSMIHTQLLRWA